MPRWPTRSAGASCAATIRPAPILPNEQQWSQTFDVSRSAVREAIKMLMAKSLLSSRPKVGSWVEPRDRWNLLDRDVLAWYAASPDREGFLKTVQEFRYIIEPEATALAAERRSDEQMAEISQACARHGQRRHRCRSAPRPTRAFTWPSCALPATSCWCRSAC